MTLKLNVLIFKPLKFNLQKVLLVVLFLLLSLHSQAANEPKFNLKPTYFQLQYAGNLGLLSAGIGRSFLNDKINTYIIYGYLPENIHGVNVHTIALKASYRFANSTISPVFNLDYYTGAFILYGITSNTYLIYPDYFPDDYYGNNAIHGSFFIGTRLNKALPYKKIQKISFFTELGTMDFQIWYAVINKTIGLFDIWNLCFGVAFSF
jgi:hypothetical protein